MNDDDYNWPTYSKVKLVTKQYDHGGKAAQSGERRRRELKGAMQQGAQAGGLKEGGKTKERGLEKSSGKLTDKQRKKREELLSTTPSGRRWMLKHRYPALFGDTAKRAKIEKKYQEKLWKDTKEYRKKVGWGKPGKAGSKSK